MLRRSVALSLFALVASSASAHAHGGAFRGPGDAQPPAAGAPASGGGGGAPASPGPASGPAPGQPSGGGARPPSTSPRPTFSSTVTPTADASVWQMWWGYNNAEFVDLKRALHSSDLLEGSDAFYLGHRDPALAGDRLVPTRAMIEERVVPALLRVLETERDADMVTGALVALAKIGESADAPGRIAARLRAFLPDANQEIAETAAISLGILADEASIPTLRALLFDRPDARDLLGKTEVPWRTRAFAAYGLGLIGYRSEDAAVRAQIVESLKGALGTVALGQPTPDVAVACVTAIGLVPLAQVGEDVTTSPLEDEIGWLLAFDERGSTGRGEGLDDVVRAHLATAVCRLLEHSTPSSSIRRRVVEAWIEALAKDGLTPRAVQQSQILALGRIGAPTIGSLDREIRSELVRISGSAANLEAQRFALVALAEIASRAKPDAAGKKIAGDVRDRLLYTFETGNAEVRAWSALALGVLGRRVEVRDAKVDALLVDELEKAKTPREIGAFGVACGMRGQQDATAVLLEKLDETRDDEARGYLTLALGMVGASGALEPIQDVLRASKYRPELLRQAAISLGLLGDKRIVPELIGMLEGATSLSAQASIAQGLGAIGDTRSIDPLIRMLESRDATPRARAFAAVALGIVGDKEQRAWNAKLAIGVNYRARTTTLSDGQGAGVLEIL